MSVTTSILARAIQAKNICQLKPRFFLQLAMKTSNENNYIKEQKFQVEDDYVAWPLTSNNTMFHLVGVLVIFIIFQNLFE